MISRAGTKNAVKKVPKIIRTPGKSLHRTINGRYYISPTSNYTWKGAWGGTGAGSLTGQRNPSANRDHYLANIAIVYPCVVDGKGLKHCIPGFIYMCGRRTFSNDKCHGHTNLPLNANMRVLTTVSLHYPQEHVMATRPHKPPAKRQEYACFDHRIVTLSARALDGFFHQRFIAPLAQLVFSYIYHFYNGWQQQNPSLHCVTEAVLRRLRPNA